LSDGSSYFEPCFPSVASVLVGGGLMLSLAEFVRLIGLFLIGSVLASCSSARPAPQHDFKLVFEMPYRDIQSLMVAGESKPITIAELRSDLKTESRFRCLGVFGSWSNSFVFTGENSASQDADWMARRIVDKLSCRSPEGYLVRSDQDAIILYYPNAKGKYATKSNMKYWRLGPDVRPDPAYQEFLFALLKAYPDKPDTCRIVSATSLHENTPRTVYIGISTFPDRSDALADSLLEGQVMCANLPLYLAMGVSSESLPVVMGEVKQVSAWQEPSDRLLAILGERIERAGD